MIPIGEITGLIRIAGTRKDAEEELRKWAQNLVQSAIDKIASQPVVYPPEEGENDYNPGKYMAIGMLYEFKNDI